MELSVIENDPKEVKKYLQNFVPINYYRVLDDAYLYQVRAILLHSVSHADTYNPVYAGLINDLTVTIGNNHASYTTSIKAVVDDVSVLVTKTEKLEAETSTSVAAIESIQEVYASDKEARATEVKTLTAAIKDIVIGGRNIMMNSDFSRGYREWQEASIEPLDHFIGKLFKVRSTGIVGSLMGIYPLAEFQNMAMIEGNQYSISFYAYGSILLMDEIYLTSPLEAPIKLPSVVISTDLSERRHITFKAPTGGGGLGLIIGATATKEDDWFSIGKVKVELGNRPTDWTPAPEDVDGYIARVQSTITEFRDVQVKDNEAKALLIEKLDSRVDENAATVTRELETQVTKHNALAKRTETVEANTGENKSKIEDVQIAFTDEKTATATRLGTLEAASALGAGKIETLEKVTADTDKVVSEQSTTLNAKIDNISSGGRNLLKNADFKLGVDTWGTSKITDEKNILGKLLTITNTGTTTDYFGLQPVNIFRNIRLLEGKEYVLSFYAKGNIPTINDIWITSTGNLPQQLSNAEITTGIADRTEIVFTAENTSEESSLIIGANGYAKGSWFSVVAVKLELGNKATDWTIAPEDTGEIIEQVEANIEEYKKAQALINLATTENYTLLEASVGENKGELERLDSLVVTNTDAIGTIKNTLEVDVGGNIAKIIEDYKAVSSDVGAMGTKLDGVYAQTNPVMMGSEEVMIGSEQHYAGVWTETGARIEQGLAQSFRVDVLESSIDSNRALIKEEAITRVNAIGSLSALTTSLKANTDSNTAELENLMITVTSPDSGLSAVVTELKAVVADNTRVSGAAKSAAEEAATAAGNKGEVIFSSTEPDESKRLSQNMWIDTTAGKNTPKRWVNSKWEIVTDKVATDAASVAAGTRSDIDNIAADNKFTPTEKRQLVTVLGEINQEDAAIRALAAKYEISVVDYAKAFKDLMDYIDPKMLDKSATDTIVRSVFNGHFNKLYGARATLELQINTKIEVNITEADRKGAVGIADAKKAKEAADIANDIVKDITDDSVLTPSEKEQVWQLVESIKSTHVSTTDYAAMYGVPTTTYTTKYNNLLTYINGLMTSMTTNSAIVRSTFNRYFTELYDERSKLDKSIRDKAKSITTALDDSLNPVMIGSNSVFIGDETILLGVWSETSERIHEDFLNQVRAAEAKAAADKAQQDADSADLHASRATLAAIDAKDRADKAQKEADVARDKLLDISADSKLTASEKQQTKIIVSEINLNHSSNIAQASKYEVDSLTYTDMYDELMAYITPLLTVMTTTDEINRIEFDGKFNKLFTARANLHRDINAAARLAVKNAQDSADIANGNFEPAKLATLVEGSGAFATELGAIAGNYTKMEGVLNGQKAAIETYNSVGNLEALKNEIAKERLNKSIEGLDAQKAKLTTAVADFTAQITLLNTKIAATEIEEVKAEYRKQISSLEDAIDNANAEKSIIDDNKRQLASEVRQMEDLELVKDKILLESGLKMTGPGGKVKGIGLIMEDTGYTNFDIIVDNFTMSVDENAKSVKPFRVNGTEFEVNVPLKANSTITTPSIQGGSITGTSININEKFKVSAQGDLTATSGTFKGNISGATGTFTGSITGASGRFTGTVLANKLEGKVANIENAAVDTLQVANNAITAPKSAFTEAIIVVGNTYKTIQTLIVPSDMGATMLTFNCVFSFTTFSTRQQLKCRILKNGVPILTDLEVFYNETNTTKAYATSNGGSHTHQYTYQVQVGGGWATHETDTKGAGTHSHTVTVENETRNSSTFSLSRHDTTMVAGTFELQLIATSGGNVNISNRYIHSITMRR